MGYRLCQGYTRYYTLPPYRFRGPIVFAVKVQPFGVLSVFHLEKKSRKEASAPHGLDQ